MSYSTPLTAWRLTEAPPPMPPRFRDLGIYADFGDSAQALMMATHPAVRAGLARTPETVAEYDAAAQRVGVSVQTIVDISLPRIDLGALDSLASDLARRVPWSKFSSWTEPWGTMHGERR